ncbi:hypothetical protein [Pseudomonas sp. MS19]|uniref:hypothetical protein n=1 Tax=Pseudomonas sp. MS19 TaxID=2579939 RepID=UPI001562AB35|nr:hypothetical protein [Pseudomonas sp. MS19]NRH27591.1 hypothetical protein [Pseudomonas sp. MS19]
MSHVPSLAVRLLTAKQGKTPLMFKRVLLRSMSTRQAASVVAQLSVDAFREIALYESVERVARLAAHLDPETVRNAYLNMPDSFHLKLTRELCSKQEFSAAAGFADLLTGMQLKVLFFAINSVSHVVQVIKHMKNEFLVVESIRNCSTSYLRQLTEEAVKLGDVDDSAHLLGMLPMQRQVDVCAKLSPAILIPLMPQLLPINDHELSRHLPPKLMDALFGAI